MVGADGLERAGEVTVLVFDKTGTLTVGRGLHSLTFQLNVSTLHGTGGARRGCVGGG